MYCLYLVKCSSVYASITSVQWSGVFFYDAQQPITSFIKKNLRKVIAGIELYNTCGNDVYHTELFY